MFKKVSSDFLFAQPSFLSGAARVLDLGGTYDSYNTSDSAEEADFTALQMDWYVVGNDLRDAIEVTADSHEKVA
jgi:hypothetical protein